VLSVYNSLSRTIEPFVPSEDGHVRMFTCGPSIYQRPHIGNHRTYLFQDVLQRYLEYSGYTVVRGLNFTDIEEKSILEAAKRRMDVLELTRRCGTAFWHDFQRLRMKAPAHNPRSSTSVAEAVQLIQALVAKGHAYWHEGNVYFDPLTFAGFGKLAHLDMTRWPKERRRFHKDTYPDNRWNQGDFILWHGYNPGDTVYWDTAIGRGRPAWNVQDPAMALQTMGLALDIYCGGEDNLVRHHDYSIAVAESVTGQPLARFWLHGAHLLVAGKKMSKSKGNVIYLDDLLNAGFTSEEIRFFLIYGQYRARLNFTPERLTQAAAKLRAARELIEVIRGAGGSVKCSDPEVLDLSRRLTREFALHMDADLDVKGAFEAIVRTLHQLAHLTTEHRITGADAQNMLDSLTQVDQVLQVFGLASFLELNDEPPFHQVHGEHE
jgi:cysteinyl-tRNA synthetase